AETTEREKGGRRSSAASKQHCYPPCLLVSCSPVSLFVSCCEVCAMFTTAGCLLTAVLLQAAAPVTYRVQLETTKGTVVIAVHRGWAPRGADRFRDLVERGYYDD